MADYARGVRGIAAHRHGMPSLLPVAAEGGGAYLPRWPQVDVDVKQKFRFGGIGALLDHEIDLLVTPDPSSARAALRAGVRLRAGAGGGAWITPWPACGTVEPAQLADEVLITYPVETGSLDVYNLFLTPAGVTPACTRPSSPPT